MLLVRTPLPFPTESFSGYLIRVAEENGYDSIHDILAVAGATTSWKGGWKIETDRIERVLNFAPEQLRHISNYRLGQKETAVLLEQQISHSQLTGSRPRICPECIVEAGFIEANWDLRLMVACPMHRRLAISACSKCGEPLSLYRPKMLKCKCGASFVENRGAPVDDEVIDLQFVLSATALPDSKLLSSSCGMPITEMSAMSLRGLTSVIECLGTQSIESLGLESSKEPELIVSHAAKVFSDWPEGFRVLLRRLTVSYAKVDTAPSTIFKKYFGELFDKLFRRYIPHYETEFLRRALIEFGVDEWTEGVIDPRLMKGVPLEGKRFQSLSQVAKKMGVMQATAKRMARNGHLPLIEIAGNTRTQFVGEIGAVLPLMRAPGASYDVRKAAALLGLPQTVLKSLRKSGHFSPRYIGTHIKCFHEKDLHAFNDKCMAAAEQSRSAQPRDDRVVGDTSVVELGRALRSSRFKGSGEKPNLVVAVLEGALPSHGNTGRLMSSILLGVDELKSFYLNWRFVDENNTRSFREAADIIGCDIEVIPSLAQQQLLASVVGKGGRRITEVSLKAFCQRFLVLSDIARRYESSSKHIATICRATGIELVTARRTHSGALQNFIGRENAEKVESTLSRKKLADQTKETRSTPVEALQRYFDELVRKGRFLPRQNRLPNKFAIARACHFQRNIFRPNSEAAKLLEQFDVEDRTRAGIETNEPFGSLKHYLADLARSGGPLPRYGHGRPNKLKIAQECHFNRNFFYTDAKFMAALDAYDRSEIR